MNGFEDGISRWRRVADEIRSEIVSGTFSSQLPTEAVLAARFGVNRHTVRRALAALGAEGLLRSERGRGTFINPLQPRITYPIGSRARFSENMMRQSLEPSGRLIGAERTAATPAQAIALGLAAGAPLLRLEHLAVAGGMALSRSTSYFSAMRFPDIIGAYAETGSITRALAQSGVEDYRRLETRITAERIATPDADLLQCPADAIVLVSEAIDVDAEGRPIQWIRTRFLADRLELVFSNEAGAATRVRD
ncbi:phosphonate metabolism transcriptional regulator PhnF [Rhizobium sp. YIM 134829]|uniref:phosphonate metabolism transcriptional regulator PhnF n=1 Tax=Rhizobium sp. YIM 134829 TaxID=3390453 RepID=UPI003978D163